MRGNYNRPSELLRLLKETGKSYWDLIGRPLYDEGKDSESIIEDDPLKKADLMAAIDYALSLSLDKPEYNEGKDKVTYVAQDSGLSYGSYYDFPTGDVTLDAQKLPKFEGGKNTSETTDDKNGEYHTYRLGSRRYSIFDYEDYKKYGDILAVDLPDVDVFPQNMLPEVTVTGYRPIELRTHYPFTDKEYPYTGHSSLSIPITDKVRDEYGMRNKYAPGIQLVLQVNKDSASKDYNLLTNNCSDETLAYLNEMFGTKEKPLFFTTPGDVRDYAINKLKGKRVKKDGVDTVLIPRDKTNADKLSKKALEFFSSRAADYNSAFPNYIYGQTRFTRRGPNRLFNTGKDPNNKTAKTRQFDDAEAARYIGWVENADSVGFDRKRRIWTPPKSAAYDRNSIGMGLDMRKENNPYVYNYLRDNGRLNNPYLTEKEERMLREKTWKQKKDTYMTPFIQKYGPYLNQTGYNRAAGMLWQGHPYKMMNNEDSVTGKAFQRSIKRGDKSLQHTFDTYYGYKDNATRYENRRSRDKSFK